MFKQQDSTGFKALYSINLTDALADFYLSRKAMLCSPATLDFYKYTAGYFTDWLLSNGIDHPNDVSSRHIRGYLSGLSARGLKSNTIHGHARAIKTFMLFCFTEGYASERLFFAMPAVGRPRLPVLTRLELKQLLEACISRRDRALVMFLTDTGARRAELIALNWGDVNIDNGIVLIARGKGNKSRTVIAGVKTRRALIKYRNTVRHKATDPLFQTQTSTRLAASGLRSLFQRLGARGGVKVSPHTLRRTFATMSLRAGMNVLHLQGLLGHSSLEMTQRYVELLEGDLVEAHRAHGPIDNL